MEGKSYARGALLGVATAFAFATQEPLSFLAAKGLSGAGFVLFTQIALMIAAPLMLLSARSRSDAVAILADRASYPKLAGILALGISGLAFYKLGLAGTNPIVVAAILNLSPFWAVLVARWLTHTPLPVGVAIFALCFAAAFAGAMTVAFSQLASAPGMQDTFSSLLTGKWVFALPIPLATALSATLIGKWFAGRDERAAIAVNLMTGALLVIPVAALLVATGGGLKAADTGAILLLMLGSAISAGLGRLLYQVAMSATGGDNGFVSMFFLLVPALTGLLSWPLSMLIPSLKVEFNASFFVGLALIASALLAFSFAALREAPADAKALAPS